MINSTEPGFIAHACAKINLSLEVLRKRNDGYHEIETIFQSVSLRDELRIGFRSNSEIHISSTDPDLPTDSKNLCYQAVEEFRSFTGAEFGADIHIVKQIPSNAGLGGGSSDAAAVLLACNKAHNLNIPLGELEKIALKLGSDVPFLLHGGTMLGRGRGEALSPVTALTGVWFVIVKPPVDISTEWAYKNYNFILTKHRYRINLRAVNTLLARFPEVSVSFRNALEDAVCPAYPGVAGVLDDLLGTDPSFASMSGSGSAVYAIYRSEAMAARVAQRFSVQGHFTAVVEPTVRAVELFPVSAY